jgi:galactose-1-phosphate uridylyltransferase
MYVIIFTNSIRSVTIAIAKFHTKNSKILQILQLAICQLICNMYDWKYFVILVPASYVNVSENYNLHFAFYIKQIISQLQFLLGFKISVKKVCLLV